MATPSTLTEKAFADRRRADWNDLATLAEKAERRLRKLAHADVVRLPMLYRSVCADLAAAQAAPYSAALVDYLLGLTAAAHTVVYGPHARGRRGALGRRALREAWFYAFPLAVRARWKAMVLATLLFFVPFALGLAFTIHDPAFAFRVAPESMLRTLTAAYAKGFAGGREAGEGVMMAGFYVYNNVGIALRCFALGILAGLGAAFYLVHNGLSMGAIFGYVASQGAGANIGTFIVGHGSLELGAIVLSGGAGMSMGWSFVVPGDLPRIQALQGRAREVVVIVGGAAVMLVMAAMLEAFWSASAAPNILKLGVGGTLFALVLAYIFLAGRPEQRR